MGQKDRERRLECKLARGEDKPAIGQDNLVRTASGS